MASFVSRVTSAVLACYKAAFSSEPDHPANAHVKLEALAYAYKQFGMVMPNVMKTNDRFSLVSFGLKDGAIEYGFCCVVISDS